MHLCFSFLKIFYFEIFLEKHKESPVSFIQTSEMLTFCIYRSPPVCIYVYLNYLTVTDAYLFLNTSVCIS